MPPTQACAIQTPELLRPRRKIRDSGYGESQSEDATANQPANPEPRLNQGLRVRQAPPVSNQRAGYFGRTFQNSENKTNRGTFKRTWLAKAKEEQRQLEQAGPWRLGAGTLFPDSLRRREDPSARSHAPRPLGASQTENKNKGFARLGRLRRSREDAAVSGGLCAPPRSRMRPGL
ncbi:hypothetical protein NN561_005674 [Cricetulus griseus]